jgi:hypothetical protein
MAPPKPSPLTPDRVARLSLAVAFVVTGACAIWLWTGLAWPTGRDTPAALAVRSAALLQTYPAPGPRELQEAERLTRRQLQAGPYQADAWAQLAYIAFRRAGRLDANALEDLRRAYVAAPLQAELLTWRLHFAFENWESLTPELRRSASAELTSFYADYENRARLDDVERGLRSESGRLAFGLTKAGAVSASEGAPPAPSF